MHHECALVFDWGVRGLRRRDSTPAVLRAVLSTYCAAGECRRERASRSRPHCGFPSSAFASWLAALLDAPASLSSTSRKASARAGLRKSIWHAEATGLRLLRLQA
jgi:hypothetical protein